MPEVLLKTIADKLDTESLQAGIVETIIDKGARNVIGVLPFDSFTGASYDYNLEKSLPTDDSAESPYGDDIASGVGEPERVSLDVAMLARDVKTPIVNDRGKSTINNQRARDIQSGAKKMARDFIRHHVGATGFGVSLNGFEKFLLDYAGDVHADGTRAYNGYLGANFVQKPGQKVFHTDDGFPGGTTQQLDSEVLRNFLNLAGDDDFDMLWVDEETYVQIQLIVEGMPGNWADHVMDENFGRPVLTFNGVGIMKLDAVGEAKTALNVAVDGDGSSTYDGTITVKNDTAANDGHNKFHGWTDADIGRSFTLYDSGGSAISNGTGTIADVDETDTSPRAVVDVTWTGTAPADQAHSDGSYVVLDKTNLIYGLRYDSLDGATAFYHETMGAPANAGPQYQGPIAGFNATNMDRERSGMRALLTQLDWFGNFAIKSPYAVARLSHFDFGS